MESTTGNCLHARQHRARRKQHRGRSRSLHRLAGAGLGLQARAARDLRLAPRGRAAPRQGVRHPRVSRLRACRRGGEPRRASFGAASVDRGAKVIPVNVALVYKKTRKLPDLFWNLYVCRPIAAVFVDLLKDTRVTPNQITISAVFVAAASAAMLVAWPGYTGLVVAALVFEFSYVLDCAGGMLARWRGVQSTAGHFLDFLMAEIKAFVMLATVAVRLFSRPPDPSLLSFVIAALR